MKNGSPELLKISAGKRYSGKIQKVRIAGEEIALKIEPGRTVTLKSARKDKKRIMEQ